ncbi:unnamed protein product [Cochlearia groenlandica]
MAPKKDLTLDEKLDSVQKDQANITKLLEVMMEKIDKMGRWEKRMDDIEEKQSVMVAQSIGEESQNSKSGQICTNEPKRNTEKIEAIFAETMVETAKTQSTAITNRTPLTRKIKIPVFDGEHAESWEQIRSRVLEKFTEDKEADVETAESAHQNVAAASFAKEEGFKGEKQGCCF